MNLIQILLIPLLLLLMFIYVFYFKNKIINRLLFFILFLVGIVFVLFPELSNKVAHFVGVGRGADLILYLTIILFYASFLFLYSKLKKLEAIQTTLIRKGAIENAIHLDKPEDSPQSSVN